MKIVELVTAMPDDGIAALATVTAMFIGMRLLYARGYGKAAKHGIAPNDLSRRGHRQSKTIAKPKRPRPNRQWHRQSKSIAKPKRLRQIQTAITLIAS